MWISAGAVILLGFLLVRDSLARMAWQRYGRADTALALNRGDAGLAMQLGNYYFGGTIGRSEYDPERAEQAYRRAVAVKPGILWGHYQLARIYFVGGNYDLALEEINKELEANPENLRSLYIRGLIYGYRNFPGDLEKTEADFRRFTRWAPKEWAGYNDFAWVLSRSGKYNEAKEAILLAFRQVRDGEKNPWLWNSLGVAELNLGDYPGARLSFLKAKELAEKLTISEWGQAYPGNNPANAAAGLQAFREAIEENLRRSRDVDNPS